MYGSRIAKIQNNRYLLIELEFFTFVSFYYAGKMFTNFKVIQLTSLDFYVCKVRIK